MSTINQDQGEPDFYRRVMDDVLYPKGATPEVLARVSAASEAAHELLARCGLPTDGETDPYSSALHAGLGYSAAHLAAIGRIQPVM